MKTETLLSNKPATKTALKDELQRPLHDLRVSVIDQCNFRCVYCMPKDRAHPLKFTKQENWLSFDEIVIAARIFAQLGVEKIRITGGEPLLRPGLPKLIEKLASLDTIKDLALTTNGSLLSRYAQDLKLAGLKRLTVSLNTLDEKIFKKMNGDTVCLQDVLKGINKAEESGFLNIRINVVIQKGVNEHKIMDLIERFRHTGHILRFIEYMDVGTCNHWQSKQVVPAKELIKMIGRVYPLHAARPNYYGEVSKRFFFRDGAGEIGFVTSISQPFCHSCTRARLSAKGQLFTCLFSGQGYDLVSPLRSSEPVNNTLQAIKSAWKKRNDRYSELRQALSLNQEKTNRLEMFQIGG